MTNVFKILNIKEVNTSFYPNIKFITNDGRAIAELEYASAIGSFMYDVQCTRLNIAFAVKKFSRFSVEHWKAIDWEIGYIKST